MKMAKEQLAGESKHEQFNRDQGRQEPSGEDTALMIDCNTNSGTEPKRNNCYHHCTSLLHNNQGCCLTGNLNRGPGLSSLFGTSLPNASNRTTNVKQNDPREHNRVWTRMNNIPSRTPMQITLYRGASILWFLFDQYQSKCLRVDVKMYNMQSTTKARINCSSERDMHGLLGTTVMISDCEAYKFFTAALKMFNTT